ncbi:phage protein, partial [Bacillus sp. SIMBA_074]
FQKLPDKPFRAQGQQVSWVFMAADIDQSVA